MNPESVHPDFRLWMTVAANTDTTPPSLLQGSLKIAVDHPVGLRAHLLRSLFVLLLLLFVTVFFQR